MRQYISHILYILLAICFVGCNDDIITSDSNDGNEHVYTLQLAIDESPASRSLTSAEVGGGFKTRWCYGDKVTLLQTSTNNEYEFVIETPTGKTTGDPVDDRVATFTYRGESISSFTNFTGTLKYDCGTSKDNVITSGYTIDNKTKYENESYFNGKIINVRCHPYALQSANNNVDHLKCLDNLSHSFKNDDLSQLHVVSMSRDFSIIKIVLDDIYYPIYGGAMLFVKGFKKLVNGAYESTNAGMVLGMGIVGTDDDSLYPPKSLTETNMQKPGEKGHVPFYAVPAQTDPLTGYAVRDDTHKLVAYMPVFDDLEVCGGDNLEICLRDSWSLDSYFWTTGSLKPFKLPLGSVYTIDLTRKAGGRHLYESYAAINLGNVFSSALGNLTTRNMCAKSLTDTGEYYMFGHDKPIFPGGHYPKYPDITCYYYCQSIEGTNPKKVHIMYYNANGEAFKSEIEPPSSGNLTGSTKLKLPGGEEHRVDEWWKMWVNGLSTMPYETMGMNWTLPGNMTVANFKNDSRIQVSNEVVSGAGGSPIGVRLSSTRTGHSVFIPISGVLEASEKNLEMRYITPDAVAGVKAGTERYAVITGEPININTGENTICISAYSFMIGDDNTTITREKAFYELDVAGPVRPSLSEHEKLGALIYAIPGY